METKRIVDINTYWAEIIRDTAQFGQIAVAENPEFNRLADCIFRALKDSFIHSATEYGVKRWESMLQIAPSSGETLEERKARILTYLNLKLPYTWRVLKQLIEGIVGEDKVTLDYVNDESKLVVHTDRLSDEKLQTVRDLIERVVPMNLVVEQYNHHFEVSWRDINKYAECETVAQIKEVNPDFRNDKTSDNGWIYPLTALKNAYALMWGNNLPTARISYVICDAPNATNAHSAFPHMDVTYFEGDWHNVTNADYLFYRDWVSKNVLTLKTTFPALSTGISMFTRYALTKESALCVLNSIPAYTSGSHRLTIGIHVDHKTDEEVLAAIADAEAKGWTLTVQWNGTPTSGVSTLDLEEIYAKVTEDEHGEYADENGTRCSLDWGHYVTDTTDYKLFFSIYEAEQYFKLTKIEGIEQ